MILCHQQAFKLVADILGWLRSGGEAKAVREQTLWGNAF
jgi:hypothetical protein